MKFYYVLLYLLLVVLAFPLPGASDESAKKTGLWLESSVAMAAAAPGDIRDVSFIFSNPLSTPISITNATADCGCVNLRRPYGSILPGATGTVSASVRAGAAEGPFVNRIYVLFDNGEYSKLDIRGEVRAFLKVTPPSLEMRDMVPGEVQDASFEITVTDNADTEILRTRIDGGDIELKEFRSERKGSTIDCTVSVVPRVAVGRLVGTLILETSHPDQRELQIPILIYPKIPLEIQPSSAFLGIVKQGATVKKEFTLRWNDAKPGNIKKVRYGNREAVFSVTDTGKATVLDVEFLCAGSPGFATGELVLELDNPAAPRITIPYSCMVRK
ncbi:MAG TPA: DUF1573 domain-containing protein [bacterium]|nr:DUF1573 domain-containing protein [bacterium]